MTPSLKTATIGILLGIMAPALLTAQEASRKLYSAPIGLTQADVLRVVFSPAPLRADVAAGLCQARVTVEILDAMDSTVLATEGPTIVSIGNGFLMDYDPQVGPPPEREEVLVRTTIETRDGRRADTGSRGAVCPLVGSLQVYDVVSGRTRFHERDYDGTE